MEKLTTRAVVSVGTLFFSMCAIANQKDGCPPEYDVAMETVHTYLGYGESLNKALEVATKLSKSHPQSGCAQTIMSEAISTWMIDGDGDPPDRRKIGMAYVDEALKLNPKFAQAYVSRARMLLKISDFDRASDAINMALKLDPTLPGAIFAQADMLKRKNQLAESEKWFQKFIESTPNPLRKANGYYALGDMYENYAWASQHRTDSRKYLVERARSAFEKYVELKPQSALSNVNFAVFLNGLPEDYDAAERYAQKALSIADIPMARFHVAAARYQRLHMRSISMLGPAIAKDAIEIYKSTNISLDDAIAFRPFVPFIRAKLEALLEKISSQDLPWRKKPQGKPVGQGAI